MKSLRSLVVAAALLVGLTGAVVARAVRFWPYQELLDKSDLVVIAIPTATNDTGEHIELPGFAGQRVVGVETRFAVAAVLKGEMAGKEFVLHHYRPGDDGVMVVNGPTFMSFDPVENPLAVKRTFILFLVREADGRYAPVVGQTDPGMGIKEIGAPPENVRRGIELSPSQAELRGSKIQQHGRLPRTWQGQGMTLKFVKVDSEETSGEHGYGENAVDGDPNTYWHTQWQAKSPGLPHEITLELVPPSVIKGFTYLPVQGESDHGTIRDYEFYVSKNGVDFGRPVKQGSFAPGKEEKIEIFEPVKCRFVKLRAISEINGQPWTSAAEIGVIPAGELASGKAE